MGTQIAKPNFDIKLETVNNLKNLIPSYDKKFDVFYISPIKSIPAVSVDWNGEMWLRVASNGDIVGLEVENFEKVFLAKYPEVRAVWKDFKRTCLKNERKLLQQQACQSFLIILLNFLSDLFKTHPLQETLMTA
jgi:hypothetical protein